MCIRDRGLAEVEVEALVRVVVLDASSPMTLTALPVTLGSQHPATTASDGQLQRVTDTHTNSHTNSTDRTATTCPR